ncbi:MAG TPA: nuclear transport factor 2 family protein [Chitinophagaceae bacterium]|jgi:ketosteroid isomerase-like protein|nr:nuclear transport factor 2 family protein [Chitinophagaceae bacterium]
MKHLLIFTVLLFSITGYAQDKDKEAILQILDNQTKAWNNGDVENFMVGYWNNDSLMYVGKGGITYGYQPTLENYRKNYGSKEKMGQLTFNILHVKRLSPEYYQVVGKWHLKRTVGDVGGHYTLLFRKINGEWVIVSDHSS